MVGAFCTSENKQPTFNGLKRFPTSSSYLSATSQGVLPLIPVDLLLAPGFDTWVRGKNSGGPGGTEPLVFAVMCKCCCCCGGAAGRGCAGLGAEPGSVGAHHGAGQVLQGSAALRLGPAAGSCSDGDGCVANAL